MKALIERNLKVFFRDKASVFFSLLAVLIIFLLYMLFLGDVWQQNLPKVAGTRAMMDSWIMAGVLAVTSLTTVMGAFGTMVDDRQNKIVKDFSASPVSRGKIVAGYEIASFLVGSIMSLLGFVFAEVYIVMRGGAMLAVGPALESIGLILLSALWCRYCYGELEDGTQIEPNDPNWDALREAARAAKDEPRRFLQQRGIFGDVADSEAYAEIFSRHLRAIWEKGTRQAMEDYLSGARR